MIGDEPADALRDSSLFRRHEAFCDGREIDVAVLTCVVGAFFASLLSMGGAAAQGTEWPVRWIAAGLALHAYALHTRAHEDRARLRLTALLPAAGALGLILDGVIHPATAWKAHQSAVTAVTAAGAFWLVAHHTRHALHRRLLFGTISVTCALLGALTFGDAATLTARFAGRTPDAVYVGHATGPFGTPGEFAALMVIGFFAATAHTLLPRKTLLQRISAFYPAALTFAGLLAADTLAGRYALAAGFATLGLLWCKRRSARVLVAIAAAGILCLIHGASTGNDDSAGLFRTAQNVAPLPDAATAMFLGNPMAGTGCGGFATTFESHRPAGWALNPDGAGGLFHQILAENGLIGASLILGPPLFLLIWGARHLRCLPRIKTEYDRQYDKTTRFTPEFQLSLFSACAGGTACLTALTFDYARANLAVVLALTLMGGSLIRELPPPLPVIRLRPPATPFAGRRRLALLSLPCLMLPMGALGVLKSAENTLSARDILGKLTPARPRAGYDVARDIRMQVLALARQRGELALRLAPDNAEAKLVLADALVAKFRADADPAGLGRALDLAAAATAAMPAAPKTAFTHIELLRIHGRTAEATAAVDALHAAAPNHPSVTLEYARTHIADPAKRADINRLLAQLLDARPDHAEAKRLRNLIRLADH